MNTNRHAFPTRIALSQATSILHRIALSAVLPTEKFALSKARGLVLAEDVVAGLDLPSFDNSAMDGFAFRWLDMDPSGELLLTLAGEQFAGSDGASPLLHRECIRITTGAPLPPGADTVVIKENTRLEGIELRLLKLPSPGANVRSRGEDVRVGDLVLSRGSELLPAALSLVAALGEPEIVAHRRPTVAVFTTGDELRAPGLLLGPGQIYDSNRVLLQALLAADGFESVAWPALPDDPSRIEAALRDAAFSFDIVITCGGVSVGEKDHLPALLETHGEIYFWKVMMRPGMPVLAGRLGDSHLLCLPGNPVAVYANYFALVRPFMDALQARSVPRPRTFARLSSPIEKKHDRVEFLRGFLSCDEQATLWVEGNPADGSHRLRAVAESNALIVVPEGAQNCPEGSVLEVIPTTMPASR